MGNQPAVRRTILHNSFNHNTMTNANQDKATSQTEKKSSTAKSHMQSSQLMQLFEDELKDIYWAENALVKALPTMIEKATSPELIEVLTSHLSETKAQVARLEDVFMTFGKKAAAEKCEAIAGLIKEAEAIIQDCEEGSMRDAGIIAAAQKIEHYEIATYGTLRQFAETLGMTEATKLLKTSLEEEKASDEKLTIVAVSAINVEAAETTA